MSSRSVYRLCCVAALAGILAFAPAASALPLDQAGPAVVREVSGGFLEWLGSLFGVWAADEGDRSLTIDPNGQPQQSDDGDWSMTIDPNG